MLGQPGFSQKLPELPPWVSARLAHHARTYKELVRPFVLSGDLYHLTDQPRREGSGERWCAFQYTLPAEDRHLLFVFRLPGAGESFTLYPLALLPDQIYTVEDLDQSSRRQFPGSALLSGGLPFDGLAEEESSLILISSTPSPLLP